MSMSGHLTSHTAPPAMHRSKRKTINLMGIGIDVVDTEGLCRKVIDFAGRGTQHSVMYVNADCVLIAQKNKQYQEVLNSCDLVYADGIGVVLGARLWGNKLPGRSTAADFFPGFCERFADLGFRLYFLGGKPGVAHAAADRLMADIPGLMIVGTRHGYFKESEAGQVVAEINATGADILIIGLGAPKQELWIRDHGEGLDASVLWGVGGLFDFLSGKTPRGPRWLLDYGFEWLCRLMAEPGRLWRRYLMGNAKFVVLLLWHRYILRKAEK